MCFRLHTLLQVYYTYSYIHNYKCMFYTLVLLFFAILYTEKDAGKNRSRKAFAWNIQQFQVSTSFIINEWKCALILGVLRKHITRKKSLTYSFFHVAFWSCVLGAIFCAVIYLELCHSELRWVYLLGGKTDWLQQFCQALLSLLVLFWGLD